MKIDAAKAARNLPRNSGIILRDYDLSFEKRLALGLVLKKICIGGKISLLVAKDPELAIKLGADGIHMPEYLIGEIHKWRAKKPNWIITASAHCRRAVKSAIMEGADAVLISPIFKTSSHPEKKPLGISRSMTYIYTVNRHIAAYALGGVDASHAKALRMAGYKGFAGISWVRT